MTELTSSEVLRVLENNSVAPRTDGGDYSRVARGRNVPIIIII